MIAPVAVTENSKVVGIIDGMATRTQSEAHSAAHELDCAQQIVRILFERTGLPAIIRNLPAVIVGAGNWISFTADQAVSSETVLGLRDPGGELAFVPDVLNRSAGVRSRTSPSLHLTNLDSGKNLVGHVDAHYYLNNPIGHADEFLRNKTTAPSELLKCDLFRL